MSYATQVFVYTQRQIVILQSGFSGRIYLPQYARPLTLNRGVDNQIIFQFLNNEQKPIDITGAQITCRVISYDGNVTLLSTYLNPGLTLNGFATLDLTAADLAGIEPQKCYYSLQIPVGSANYPVFVNQNAGARGEMNIVDSILPSFVPSANVTIPTGQAFPNINPEYSPANGYIYYTSVIDTNSNPVLTIQASYDQFYGNVIIEGSTQPDVDWYPILTNTYDNVSATLGYVVEGFHPFVRMEFDSNSGAVLNILSR